MAWTTIVPWTSGETITATKFNDQYGGNLNELRAGGIALASQVSLDILQATSATTWGRTSSLRLLGFGRFEGTVSGAGVGVGADIGVWQAGVRAIVRGLNATTSAVCPIDLVGNGIRLMPNGVDAVVTLATLSMVVDGQLVTVHNVTGVAAASISNTHTGGSGVQIQGGGSGGGYALRLLSATGSTVFDVLGNTGNTAISGTLSVTGAISGAARISNALSLTGNTAAAFHNTHATGFGLQVIGGNASDYVLELRDYNSVMAFAVLGSGDVSAAGRYSTVFSRTGVNAASFANSHSGGFGLHVIGGGASNYALQVWDCTGATTALSLLGTGNATFAGTIKERARATPMGDWIDVTYAGGNFAATSGTWTVGAGDQDLFRYSLVGKTQCVTIELVDTTMSGIGAELLITLPGGVSAAFPGQIGSVRYAGSNSGVGYCRTLDAGTGGANKLSIKKSGDTNWSDGTDTEILSISIALEIA